MAGYVYRGDQPKPRMGRPPAPYDPNLCGTPKGIHRHRYLKEPGCLKCKAAYNAKRREAYRRRKEQAAKNSQSEDQPAGDTRKPH